MELTSGWRAAAADEELRRAYPEPDFDDSDWTGIDVPGQWRSNEAFAAHDGPLLYRTHFDAPPATDGSRWWLTFDGIFYNADVWLDGTYVSDSEGYFAPHSFEVTDAMAARSHHTVALEVSCDRPDDLTAKRNITGIFQHWDCLDPADNPGGIWRPVRIERSGPVRIRTLRVLCPQANAERAVVEITTQLDALTAGAVRVRTTVGATDHSAEHQLAAGANTLTWSVTVERPALWWPHALGPQPLCDVSIDVYELPANDEGVPSDTRTLTTGLRQITMRDFRWTVNGERLFLKGANLGPTTARLADATPEQVVADVVRAKAANLDLLRIHAHIARPELYAAADEAGMMIWQDFPLQWGYARGLRKLAAGQARAAVDLLGHHPSIVVWCGHNEPMALDTTQMTDPATRGKVMRQFIIGQQLPTWNKTVLDATVKRAFEKADRSRPVIAHSGVLPHVGGDGTDTHIYFGWYHGNERDFPGFCGRIPRLARFVSEFGAQAVPESDDFIDKAAWPDLDWTRLAATHGLQREAFDRYVPPANYATFDEWRVATQHYQADVLKHHIETLRRLKYRPTGGFAAFLWADAHPAVSWSVLDDERRPKLGFAALVAACQPVIVAADRPAPTYEPGDELDLAVHVVSDRRTALVDLATTVAIRFADGSTHNQGWIGDCGPDSCVAVGRIRAIVPDAPGELTITLITRGDDVDTTNCYRAQVVDSGVASARMDP